MRLPAKSFLTLLLVIIPLYVNAHPHNWIRLKTEFTLDENGQLIEVLQHWTFDIYYSAINLADISNEYESQQEGLNKLAQDMVNNLQGFDFFSELKVANQRVHLAKPSDYSLTTVLEDGQQKLLLGMRFTLDGSSPIDSQTLSWRVFDPTYYIDMRHQTASKILIHKNNNTECSTNIESPTPSAEIIDYAANLDRSMKDTQGLGSYFAEKIHIHCR